MRAFIAIVPPASVTLQLQALGAGIRSIAPALRCEPAGKLHFTLEFLGEKEEAWLEACRAALARIASAAPRFPVTLRRIGFFPAGTRPRIIWAGSQPDENAPLCSLAASVKRECARLGHIGETQEFHPHITLSRVKSPLPPGATERIAALGVDPLAFTCSEISVVQSILRQRGSEYKTLFSIPMQISSS